MGEEGIDKLQYSFISPELPKDMIEECVDILDNLNSRKNDKVNWEERRQMDEATKRSGQYISHEEDAYSETPTVTKTATRKSAKVIEEEAEEIEEKKQVEKKPKKKVIEEESPALSDKEKDLLDTLGGVMKLLEGYDGKR
jgi:hypothetical protein